MPRLGRFTVEFTIPSDPGKIWVARFTHQHGREECRHIDPLRMTPKHVWMECSHHDEKGRKLHPDHKDCPKVRLRRRCPDPSFTPVQYRIPSGPKQNEFIPVQHITTCHLSHKGSALMLTGQAPCSVKDTYNWKEGVHFSLQRALEKARYCKLVKVKDSSLCPHTPKHDDCPDVGRIIVTEKTKEYDEICEAFWREASSGREAAGCKAGADGSKA